MNKTLHCFVSGRVQGVWFRSSTREQAVLQGLTGWIRNHPDGRVEVLVSGEEEKVNLLHEWLKSGPNIARVLRLECEEIDYQPFDNFGVR